MNKVSRIYGLIRIEYDCNNLLTAMLNTCKKFLNFSMLLIKRITLANQFSSPAGYLLCIIMKNRVSGEERMICTDTFWVIASYGSFSFLLFLFLFCCFLNRRNKRSYFFTSRVYSNNLALLESAWSAWIVHGQILWHSFCRWSGVW